MEQSNGNLPPSAPPRVDLLAGLRRARELWHQQQTTTAAPGGARPTSSSASGDAPRRRGAAATPNGLRLNPTAAPVVTPIIPTTEATKNTYGGKRSRSSTTTPKARSTTRAAPKRKTKGRKTKKRSSARGGRYATHDPSPSSDEEDEPIEAGPDIMRSLVADHEFSWRVVKGRRTLWVTSSSSTSTGITHPLVLKAAASGGNKIGAASLKVVGKAAHSFWEKVKKARLDHPDGTVANAIRATHSLLPPSPSAATAHPSSGGFKNTTRSTSNQQTQQQTLLSRTRSLTHPSLNFAAAAAPSVSPAALRMLTAMNYPPPSVGARLPTSSRSILSSFLKQEPSSSPHTTIKQEGFPRTEIKSEPAAVKMEVKYDGDGGLRGDSAGSTVSSTTMRQIEQLEERGRGEMRSQAQQFVEVVELSDDSSCSSSGGSTSSSDSDSNTSVSSSSSDASSPKRTRIDSRLSSLGVVPQATTTATFVTAASSHNNALPPPRNGPLFELLGQRQTRSVTTIPNPHDGYVVRADAVVPQSSSRIIDNDGRYVDAQDDGLLDIAGFDDDYGEGF